jgi:competence protein ComEC
LLDRGYTKLDYIIISHFDQDHVGGILSILEEIKVEKIIISKQIENSENYEKFKEIIKHNNIKVIVVNKRDVINIEKDLYINILWPNNSELINENALNNNSIVCKIHYNSFSMLFTGDIEECAEKQILEEYKNNLKTLNSNILKVAHHGSKTSSTSDFIETVKPEVALIGVGKNNKFGHPNEEVIKNLKKQNIKTYRTDERGEISIVVNKNGKYTIKRK